ncbi:MAG TPA: hypothetical protein VMK32_10005 [Burkholderiaceae bacterium]|nr:hypothetical protein [Burkholderiaceae bacterium]
MAITQTVPGRLVIGTARLVLIGRPPQLAGMLRLANPTADKLKLKSGLVRLKDRQWGDPHRPLTLQVSGRLLGGTAAQVPVSLTVDQRMPPGEYPGEATFDGEDKAREVVLKVLESRDVTVTPATFELYGAPGATVAVPTVVSNLGNVPYVLPKVALVALGLDTAVTQLFHVAMARKGAQGHQAALDAYAQLVGESEVEPAKVLVGAGAGEPLAPGESLETSLQFELPQRLARHRLYRGTFSIGKAECGVEIEVAEGSTIPPEPGTARRARG